MTNRRSPLSRPALALLLVLAAAAARPAAAQGSRADYARAEALPRLVAGKVTRDRVEPRWLEDGRRFWYRVDLDDDRREFLLVDPAVPERGPAFDHSRMAEALSAVLGREIDPGRLPVEQIAFREGRLLLQVGPQAYECDLESYTLRPSDEAFDRARALPPAAAGRTAGRTGAETYLTFVNRTEGPVDLLWLEPGGGRRPYGSLPPGESRRQRTFAGHRWLVVDAQGAPVVVFEAADEAQIALVEAAAAPARGEGRARRRPAGAATSPDGRLEVRLRDHNVYLVHLETGEERRLTEDGHGQDRYQAPVHWSPDSRHFVLMQTVPEEERPLHLVESSPRDDLLPRLHRHQYLKPGHRIAHPRPRLFSAATGEQIPVPDDLFPNPWELSRLEWEPDGRRFTFLYNQRGHQVMRLISVDAETGAARAAIEEQASTFIDWTNKVFLHRVPGTGEAIWMSERDGWNHLYLYDLEQGKVKHPITRGEWVVRRVLRVDDERRQIWFTAGGIHPDQDPYHLHYCRVNFDGTGLVALTRGDGHHEARFSPDGEYLVATYSRVDLPPVTEVRRAGDGSLVLELERADAGALLATGWRFPESFVAPGRDGVTPIYGVIYRPTHFDPARRYPVIEQIYAGPHGAHVPKSFSALNGAARLAELGFIVVQIDGMGTSHRSKAFHDVCWKNLADAGFPDRILWMRAAAERYPYLDLSRVGIYGGSAGGQNALGALLRHGDFYKVAVADCGCHDNRMDKIWWNEQWMGWPVGPHYEEQSNVTLAPNLTGKLLLMVGELDTNVDPASTLRVVDALIRADKDFDLLVFPGGGHGTMGTPYGRRRLQDFFVRHLLGVEPRWEAASAAP